MIIEYIIDIFVLATFISLLTFMIKLMNSPESDQCLNNLMGYMRRNLGMVWDKQPIKYKRHDEGEYTFIWQGKLNKTPIELHYWAPHISTYHVMKFGQKLEFNVVINFHNPEDCHKKVQNFVGSNAWNHDRLIFLNLILHECELAEDKLDITREIFQSL